MVRVVCMCVVLFDLYVCLSVLRMCVYVCVGCICLCRVFAE